MPKLSPARARLFVMLAVALLGAPAPGAAEVWQAGSDTDQMTGAVTHTLLAEEAIDGGGSFQISATCDSGMVDFAYDFFAAPKSEAKLAWQESESFSGTTFGFSTNLSRDVSRWVPIRTRLGQGGVLDRNSSSRYTNEVEVVFYDPATVQHLADAATRQDPQPHDKAALGNLFQGLALALLPLYLPSTAAGTFADLRYADLLRVEIPLTDGRAPIVVIHPQTPALSAFLERCVPGRSDPIRGQPSGRYVAASGVAIVLSQGAGTATAPGHPPIAITYQTTGSAITVKLANGETLSGQISQDGALVFGDGMRFVKAGGN